MVHGLAQANLWICLFFVLLVIGPVQVAAVIRGVNIGGWLVTERWSVIAPPCASVLLMPQDHPVGVRWIKQLEGRVAPVQLPR